MEELLILIMSDNIGTNVLSDATLNLIHWILFNSKYDIETVPKPHHKEILSLCPSTGKFQVPNHIFKINYLSSSGAEKRFSQLINENGKTALTKFAYHGTRFSNMYTILSFGLQQHLNKTGLFGEGLYFSFELQVSALFSPVVSGWNKSKVGELVSCIALCEYIDDTNYCKIRRGKEHLFTPVIILINFHWF
jgi:poly[ADP-ribose] polymerase 16